MGQTNWTKEQELVINLRDRNILVSAAAGSGKTAVLVERIIQIISNKEKPVDIDRLLVVTFTKAAAAEMRSRVGDAIENMLILNPDDEHLQRQATLLHNAQITTIDSFCQNIIRNYFHVIDIDPSFRVGDENELSIIKTEVLSELLEEKYALSRENGESRFTDFTEIFSPGRTDNNIEELVLKMFNISMSYPWPEEWLESCKKIYSCKDIMEFEELIWVKELKEYIHDVISDYKKMAERALEICKSGDGPFHYEEAVASDLIQIEIIENAKSYEEYYKAFSSFNPARLSSKRPSDISAEKKEEVKALREAYNKNGIQALKKSFFYQSPEEMLNDIIIMSPYIEEFINLTKDFSRLFAEKKNKEGLLDFADMEHFALNILVEKTDEGTKPSAVAMELRDYYSEIMTDEYQDSNFVQELILTSLCNAPKSKPYIFMVGDVKQSIYKFRLARPELFMEKYNSYTVGEGPNQKIDLHENFRSRKCVLDSANFIFENIMIPGLGGIKYDEAASLVAGRKYTDTDFRIADKTDVLVIECSTDSRETDDEEEQAAGQQGYMGEDIEMIEKRTLEAAAIGVKIREMVQKDNPLYVNGKEGYRRAEYRDIVILLRSVSGWSEDFIETLTDMGIPAYSDTKTGYFSALEVCTVLDMLRVIDNPRQDIPLAAVLRSCLGRLTDEELAALSDISNPIALNYWDGVLAFLKAYEHNDLESNNNENNYDFTFLKKEESKILADKLKNFCDMLFKYQEMSKYSSVYDILQCIYRQTGYYNIMSAMPAGEKRAANLDILLQQSIEFSQNGHSGIFGFTHYIESLNKSNIDFGEASVNGENTNAVRIMSIHRSKGLQFPVVFVAGMGKQFNLQDARKSVIIDDDYGVGVDFIDLDIRIKQPTLIKKFMANRIKKNTYAEEIRILYVALTRAEEKLILTGTASDVEKTYEKWGSKGDTANMTFLLSAKNYLDWIMPVIISGGLNSENLFNVENIYQSDIITDEKKQFEESIYNYNNFKNWDTSKIYNEDMADAIKAQINYKYPYMNEQLLPVKISVTELKRRASEQEQALQKDEEVYDDNIIRDIKDSYLDDGYAQEEYTAPKPQFMEDTENITGTARGTLYHLVMEHIPYEDLNDKYDFSHFIGEMCEKGYMTEEEAKKISPYKFSMFVKSSIGERMREAAIRGDLKREQQFMFGLPAAELYPEAGSECEEIVLIQGIIDAYFEEEGEIVIVDYKTDYVDRGNETVLVDKYRAQLNYYARALENITGKIVKEKIIYSFALNDEVEC